MYSKPQHGIPECCFVLATRALIICLFLIHSTRLLSQKNNLVVNPSFENKVDFQAKASSSNWTKCLKNDTPDYIEFSSRGEPDFYYRKYIGGLLPIDGNAYAGIFCYRTNPLRGIDNIREFIQAPLSETLQRDTLYQVSLFIALDPESTLAINNFNIYFSTEPVYLNKEKQMFELRPQIRFRKNMPDSLSWFRLETTYKAKGNESQIVLGNFYPDNSLRKKQVYHQSSMDQKWNLHELEHASYYYIDMVSVSRASEKFQEPEEKLRNEIPLAQEKPSPMVIPTSSDFEIETVHPDSSIVLNNIYFEFDKSELLPGSFDELDRLNLQLQEFEEKSITIEGHTDNMGTYEYNQQLSIDRAKAVADYLIEKGLTRTEEGRSLNRRVAFRIFNTNKLK
jgi:OOP family OmpA-OmpF porin